MAILELQAWNCIFGTPPTLNDFIEPKEELEDPDLTADIFEGGDKAIVVKVIQEMAEQNGEAINVNSDDDDESGTPNILRSEAINLCQRLSEACRQHGDASSDLAISLLTTLRCFFVGKSLFMPNKLLSMIFLLPRVTNHLSIVLTYHRILSSHGCHNV
ncbi:hypothetical protein V8E55_005765 [Tylopilus felleus]